MRSKLLKIFQISADNDVIAQCRGPVVPLGVSLTNNISLKKGINIELTKD